MNEQYSADYDVRMRTPVGIRLGHMTVCRNLGKVSGFLDILNHSEPFEGIIDHDGNCEFMGCKKSQKNISFFPYSSICRRYSSKYGRGQL